MIKLKCMTRWDQNSNFRYVASLMIEARFRGYSLLEVTPAELSEAGGFNDYINRIIGWLITNYPNEFERG